MKKRRYGFSLKSMIKFYDHVRIPWWMYAVSLALGLVYAEIMVWLAEYTIAINKGELFNAVVAGFALLSVLNSVIAALQNVFSYLAAYKITYRARQMVWDKILHLPMSEVDRRHPSALISGVVNDVGTASDILTYLFLFIASVYAFARACVELFQHNATLAVFMLATIPVAVLSFNITGRIYHEIAKRQYGSLREMTEFFSEHVSAAKHVKTKAMEKREERAGFEAIDKRYKADIYAGLMSEVAISSFSLYNQIDTIVMALVGSQMIRKGEMPSSGINEFDTYMGQVHRYTAEILTGYQALRSTQGALQYVGEMLEGPQEELDTGAPAPAGAGTADLVLEHVTFGYDPAEQVLRDLSVTIPGGKMTAIIGGNGSGKSTLLKLLQGLYTADSGTIRMGGTAISEIAPHELRKKYSYILQNNPLFSGTIRDNIAYGVPDAREEDVVAAAKLADADDFIRALPGGYDADIGEGGKLLSGGQRQRVAIARALMMDPQYLLMDEAGASLDPKSDDTIFHSVRKAMRGRTVVVVAHDMRSVVDADHIIVLDHGTLEAEGTHEELLETSPTYRGYLEKQGYALTGEEAAR